MGRKTTQDAAPPRADTTGAGLDRRALLKSAGASLAAPVALAAPAAGAAGAAPTAEAPDPGPAPAPPSYQPAFFNDVELAFVRAAVDRLVPRDEEGPGALDLGAAEFIDRQLAGGFGNAERMYMMGPFARGTPQQGYQSALRPNETYRAAIADVDRHCRAALRRPFADLAPAERDAVLAGLQEGRVALPSVDARAFFDMLWANTREGMFCDPAHGGNAGMGGWKMIGFPGARADHRDVLGRPERVVLDPVALAQAPAGTARR